MATMNEPQLRFPEFNDEWQYKKLAEVTKINQGLQIPISERLTEKVPNSYFYITNEFIKVNSERKYYIFNPSPNVICTKDDILMTRTGNTGIVITNVAGVFHNNFFKVKYSNELVKDFLYLFLNLDKTQKIISKLAGTSTIPDLNHSDFYRIPISFPCLSEQTKIANFLTAVDEKIQALRKKKELTQQYKKGIMQRIFSQELRFTDENGNPFPDWEEKKLGEFFTFRITNSFSRENLNYSDGTVKNIHYGDIHTKFKSLFNVIKEEVPFINPDINLMKIENENYCKNGDLILADASEDLFDVGKSIEIVNTNGERILAGLHTILARPNPQVFVIGFLGHLFNSNHIRRQIQKQSQGSKVLSISVPRLSIIVLNIPSQSEQTKIANFLSAIDERIALIDTQLQQSEAWKKGLLQQMFC